MRQLAADSCHLHLWTTEAFREDAINLMRHWGFEHKSCRVWDKVRMGMGNYWRLQHEFLLLGVRGKAITFPEKNHRSVVRCKPGRHSEKPDEFRLTIERVSPGPYLELFGRKAVPGWTVFGNEVETT